MGLLCALLAPGTPIRALVLDSVIGTIQNPWRRRDTRKAVGIME